MNLVMLMLTVHLVMLYKAIHSLFLSSLVVCPPFSLICCDVCDGQLNSLYFTLSMCERKKENETKAEISCLLSPEYYYESTPFSFPQKNWWSFFYIFFKYFRWILVRWWKNNLNLVIFLVLQKWSGWRWDEVKTIKWQLFFHIFLLK